MSCSRSFRSIFGTVVCLLLDSGFARADNDPAVLRGIQFLKSSAGTAQVGETALTALALIKADVPQNDPAVVACLNKLRSRFSATGYQPERSGGPDIYEAGVVAMALANADASSYRSEIAAIARFLIGRQNANGSWDYVGRSFGDTSISQYAVLGLWEADNAGARVPPDVWDRAARWYLSVQSSEGSWTYHRDAGGQETIAMTAAGTGSLLICQRQLGKARQKAEALSPLLTPLGDSEQVRSFTGGISSAALEQAIRRGLAWIGSHFTTGDNAVVGPSAYYALYGIERIGALADRESLGRVNWYEVGRTFIYQTQQGNGSWNSSFGVEPNTVWAILFITKSTAKTLQRIEIKRLGAGTLLGGRGLPSDLTSLTVAGGRIISRPMNGAVEGMLAVLEDPRTQNADAALAGLVNRYQAEGPEALRPHKDRFRKLLTDRDPGLRRIAAWALGRTGDLDVVPVLIDALTDPDQDVVDTARLGLQLLSRKMESLGPPSPSTPDQRAEAARRWRGWYQAIRPLGEEDDSGERRAPAPSPNARSGSAK
jgi:hypothetical protein